MVIIIDPDKKKAEKIRKMLEKSTKNIAIINTRCLFPRHREINELIHNNSYRKMFYGCTISFFNEMVKNFNKQQEEPIYIGSSLRLNIEKIVRYYWTKVHKF